MSVQMLCTINHTFAEWSGTTRCKTSTPRTDKRRWNPLLTITRHLTFATANSPPMNGSGAELHPAMAAGVSGEDE